MTKVVFFGSSNYVLPIIEVLKNNFDLALVVTTEKEIGIIPKYCLKNKIPFVSISSFAEIMNHESLFLNHNFGVLADFGLIVPSEILNSFEYGIFNVHPSLLPRYRGPSPVQTAILNNDEKTGVSIIKLDEKMDHGSILKQVEEPILETDTAESLYQKLFAKGAQILSDSINSYFNKRLIPVAQNDKEATYTKRLIKSDGYINLSDITSENFDKNKFERMIMAYYPWPGVYTKSKIKNQKSKIIKFLPQQKIQVEGGKPMNYRDFLNGYPEAKEWLAKII